MGSRFWPRSAAPRRKQGKVAILGGAAGGFFCEGGVKMVISLYKKRGGEQKSTAKASCNDLLLLAMLLLPLLSCSLSLLLAFGCSSCTARELAALLPHPQQIKKACTAQRTVTNRFAVHRGGADDFVPPLAAAHATAPTARSAPLENFECLAKKRKRPFPCSICG